MGGLEQVAQWSRISDLLLVASISVMLLNRWPDGFSYLDLFSS